MSKSIVVLLLLLLVAMACLHIRAAAKIEMLTERVENCEKRSRTLENALWAETRDIYAVQDQASSARTRLLKMVQNVRTMAESTKSIQDQVKLLTEISDILGGSLDYAKQRIDKLEGAKSPDRKP